MRIISQSARLLWITPNALQVIEQAGRTCYKSEDKITNDSAIKFVQMLISRGHESVLEHASASFRLVTDRGISHELVRHRIASYSQESTRYCCYKDEITVIQPPFSCLPKTSTEDFYKTDCYAIETDWVVGVRAAEKAYLALIQQNVSQQLARSVLPTCLKTEVVMTANFREWRHFLKLRTSSAAHPQMQELAGVIKKILIKEVPVVFEEI